MCLRYMKIKGVNYTSPNAQFVPCGKCEECRDMLRSGWSFRIRAELQELCINQGWHCGFLTLTYNDENLPHLPHSVFKDYDDCDVIDSDTGELLRSPSFTSPHFVEVSCFDKQHIRDFIHPIRKYLNREYGVKRLVWLVCSEYGSNTQRPHYHCLFAFPPNVPPSVFYGLCRDYWCGESNIVNDNINLRMGKDVAPRPNRGFICPRQLDGYKDEKPFIVSDVGACGNYCSKYVCKDVFYYQYIKGLALEKTSALRRYMPFHMQTRSLGASILAGKSDSQLLDIYQHGFGFLGEKALSPIPVYIRDKIIFNPYYIVDNQGKRLVRKESSVFAKTYHKEIFEKKLQYYATLFQRTCSADFFLSRFLPKDTSDILSTRCSRLVVRFGAHTLALHYLCYYGIQDSLCYRVAPSIQWLNRYDEFGSLVPPNTELQDPLILSKYREAVSELLGYMKFCKSRKLTIGKVHEAVVADFHKSKGGCNAFP